MQTKVGGGFFSPCLLYLFGVSFNNMFNVIWRKHLSLVLVRSGFTFLCSKLGAGGWVGPVGGGGGQVGCERRSEVIVKMQKKVYGRGGGSPCYLFGVSFNNMFNVIWRKHLSLVLVRSGFTFLCSKLGAGGWVGPVGGGVRLDVNEEVKLL